MRGAHEDALKSDGPRTHDGCPTHSAATLAADDGSPHAPSCVQQGQKGHGVSWF